MAEPPLDLSRPRRIHVVGIGGAGMSAIATVLATMGHTVSGSDLKGGPLLDRLAAQGITVAVGHDGGHVGEAEAVSISTAIPANNAEVVSARERGVPVLSRADTLAAICATRRTVAVAGTHGKTTTSSMLALILTDARPDASFIIGGEVNDIGTGAVWGTGDLLVVEADESDGTFVRLGAEAVIVTSIEPDHLEHYGGYQGLVSAFRQFLEDAPGPRLVCADDPEAAALGRLTGAASYGQAADAEWRMTNIELGRSRSHFDVEHDGEVVATVELPVPGIYNAQNGCGALVMALLLGVEVSEAVGALARYGGVARRFQFRGERDGITFVDDYAHLPGEVRVALAAARDGGWSRVVCCFQPHRYSRTATLWRDFADAFVEADLLVLTDIYSAGEAPRPGVTGELILRAVLDAHPGARVAYLPKRSDVAPYLRRTLRPGDLCLTLGAGDLTSIPDELLHDEAAS
ncbi:MAG: UDP-N-acetylmuramate--alanine ligase [Actinomycetota bacterium]|jgi:UDP-N-acetylmuramate--alanine ligase|nr:UDP-N-acetylmuramate--alanine ligase [Actinomycetota bacterium]